MLGRLRAWRVSTLLVIGVLLVACGGSLPASLNTTGSAGNNAGETNGSQEPLRAVATTSILGDLVQQVGGQRVAVQVLLPPGTDPHTYAPTPRDVQAVTDAQILFENGLGLEDWLAELIENAGGSRPTVSVSEGLTPLAGIEHDEQRAADEHAAVGSDPHMWLDVQNTMGYVQNIQAGLTKVDPAGAATYDTNAAAYLKQLEALDADIQAQVASVPQNRRKLVTNHDTFVYFAKRYNFEIVGSVFENVSTEQEPSAQQIAELVQLIRAQDVPAVFAENTVNPRLAEQIADEAGIAVVTDLYTDALGSAGSEADSYLSLMRHNVQRIVAALTQ